MTEENKELAPKDGEEVVEEVVDPVEDQARVQGWVNQDEWVAQGRDPKDHRSAKEFVERGELYKSIHSTKRELQQAKAALDSLARHHQFVYHKAHQDAVDKLRMEKRAALKAGELEAVEEIDSEIEQRQAQHAAVVTQFQREQAMAQAFNQVPPELDAWMVRNPWYQQDVDMRFDADAEGQKYLAKGGTREGLLQHVEKKMRERYPEQFGIKRSAPNAVAAVNRTGRSVKQTIAQEAGLDELETKIMNDLVKSGVMTKADYIKQLNEAKGIK